MLTLEMLQGMNEDEFRKEVLAPLFKAMGFRNVEIHQGGVGAGQGHRDVAS